MCQSGICTWYSGNVVKQDETRKMHTLILRDVLSDSDETLNM